MSFVVAIDGPVAAGKGTIARQLAAHFGFEHLATGALYRAAALQLLAAGGNPEDAGQASEAARRVGPEDLASPDLRLEKTGMIASKIAGFPDVRSALVDLQRNFAQTPPNGAAGAVLEGRDITTVICPDANVKIYLTAAANARAKRRYEEATERGEAVDFEDILADLIQRDKQDSERADGALKKADDAHLLDTTNLSIEAAFEVARQWIDAELTHG